MVASLVISISFVTNHCLAQDVRAGVVDSIVLYQSNFTKNLFWINSGLVRDTIFLDVDLDGVEDLNLRLKYVDVLFGEQRFELLIEPKNDVEITFDRVDSCMALDTTSPMFFSGFALAKSLKYGLLIKQESSWADSGLFHSYSSLSTSNPPPSGHYCYGGSYAPTDSMEYFGFRKLLNNDTLYGWIGLQNLSSDSIILRGIVMEKNTINVNSYSPESQKISVYPNPVNAGGVLSISSDKGIKRLVISTLDGAIVHDLCRPYSKDFIIDLEGLSAGMYALIIDVEDGVVRQKLLVR